MPSGPSNQESEPLLPTHINPIPNLSNHTLTGTSSVGGSSTTPTRSRLSARRYTPTSSASLSGSGGAKGKGKGKAKLDDLERGLSSSSEDSNDETKMAKSRAKGKGKGESKEEGKGRNVTIIFSNESELTGSGNLECWIEDGENVGSLKEQIKTFRPALASHNIRLIHSGRLLTDGILLIPWLRSIEERVRRQAAGVGGDVENVLKEVGLTEDVSSSSSSSSDNEDGEDDEDAIQRRKEDRRRKRMNKKNDKHDKLNERVWLHCIVGGKEEKNTSQDEDEPSTSAPRRRGFDVLLDAGLSADDVAAMRRQFYESRGEEVPEGMEGGDINDEHARALEEQWIEGDLTAETATTTSEGMYSSILYGLLTGFLFPIIPWFFFREPPLPNFFDSDAEAITTALSTTQSSSSARENLGVENRRSSQSAELGERPSSPNSLTTTTTTTTTNGGGDGGGASAQDRFIRAGGIGIGLGEIVASQVFGKRMQMGILLGTILNLAFGALRFLN